MIERLPPRTLSDAELELTAPRGRALTARQLHSALDTLLAQYLGANPEALPSTTSVLGLLTWSYERVREQERKPS